MEFGAITCKPKNPNCITCCLNKTCKYFKSIKKIKNSRTKMTKNKNYDIFCYINKKKQIALTKNNQLSFLKDFNIPEIKPNSLQRRFSSFSALVSLFVLASTIYNSISHSIFKP